MENKKQYRSRATGILDALTEDFYSEAGRAALETLQLSELWRESKTVFCFYGVKNEIDTVPILTAALDAGKRVYLPRCIKGRPGEMELVRIFSLTELEKSRFGLLEPTGSETAQPEDIDLAVVPCLAVTKKGERLGHGGGYYDRFLSRFNGVSIALCPQAAVLPELPTEKYDESVDFVLTENGLIEAEKGQV